MYSLPLILALSIEQEEQQTFTMTEGPFPVTVDPKNKIIVEDARVNLLLGSADSPLQATTGTIGGALWSLFERVAITIAAAPWYQGIAAANVRFVTITPGMRKEQAAQAFANALAWNSRQKREFITSSASSSLPFPEGSFSPGTYYVSMGTTPSAAQTLVNERFYKDVLSRYGTTTAAIVPVEDALIVASLIQRETIGPDDMRLVSGIIWKRLFAAMKLQIDATVQYAKANRPTTTSWWPKVWPRDTAIASPYNTYLYAGLPPTAIANPSVAAILAALNPLNTPCLFYFNDEAGNIHCSKTYPEHVALLKKYYGRGK